MDVDAEVSSHTESHGPVGAEGWGGMAIPKTVKSKGLGADGRGTTVKEWSRGVVGPRQRLHGASPRWVRWAFSGFATA